MAGAAVSDLPAPATKASTVSKARDLVGKVADDVAPCSYAVNESIGFYGDVVHGALNASERSQLPALLSDDYAACSPTDQSIDDLAGIEEPSSPLGRALAAVASQALRWCDPGGMSVIYYVKELVEHPTDRGDLGALARSERYLDSEGSKAVSSVTELERFLGTTSFPRLGLARVRTRSM